MRQITTYKNIKMGEPFGHDGHTHIKIDPCQLESDTMVEFNTNLFDTLLTKQPDLKVKGLDADWNARAILIHGDYGDNNSIIAYDCEDTKTVDIIQQCIETPLIIASFNNLKDLEKFLTNFKENN